MSAQMPSATCSSRPHGSWAKVMGQARWGEEGPISAGAKAESRERLSEAGSGLKHEGAPVDRAALLGLASPCSRTFSHEGSGCG
jgi:hypothetical protein